MAEWVPGDERFPLQNRTLEQTDLFWRIGKGKDRIRALFVARDPGEMNGLSRVIAGLSEKPADIFVLVDSKAKEGLEDADLGLTRARPFSPLKRLAGIGAHVGIAGYSNNPDGHLAMTATAPYPKLWIQDEPSGIMLQYPVIRPILGQTIPDHIFTISEYGSQQEQKAPFSDRVQITMTGGPFLEGFLTEDRVGIRTITREALQIPEDRRLILYAGVPGPGSAAALSLLVDGLKASGRDEDIVAVRLHPRDRTPQAVYDEITKPLTATNRLVNTSAIRNSHHIAIASDLVVTTISSMGTDAVYRDMDSILVLASEIVKGTEAPGYTAPPEAIGGACIAVYSQQEMNQALLNLLNPNFTQRLREDRQHFKPIIGATGRIVDLTFRIAQEYKRLLAAA